MTLEEIREFCLALPGTTEDIKWENHLCFNVGQKMYLLTSPDQVPVSATMKVNKEDFTEICNQNSFIPAPYLARYNWVQTSDINLLSDNLCQEMIQTSYELVYEKLKKSEKDKIQAGK